MATSLQRIGAQMITAISPCLNELYFLPGWLANVRRYANRIVVIDTGSWDGSLEYLQAQKDVILLQDRVTAPYRWQEGRIRNRLLDEAGEGYIVKQDCDELLADELIALLPNLKARIIRTRRLDFWSSFNHVRVSYLPCDIRDLRWWPHNWATRIWLNSPVIRFKNTGNHAPLEWRGTGKHVISRMGEKILQNFYHYHWARQEYLKFNDNRALDVCRPVRLMTWTPVGGHPREVALYGTVGGR